jgi:hypothetical protein
MARARRSNARKRSTTGPTLEPEGLLAGSKIAVVHGLVSEPDPNLLSVAISCLSGNTATGGFPSWPMPQATLTSASWVRLTARSCALGL